MTLTKTKNGFILRDCGLKIAFNAYEYSTILKDVYLYRNGILVAIYENVKRFKEQLKRC